MRAACAAQPLRRQNALESHGQLASCACRRMSSPRTWMDSPAASLLRASLESRNLWSKCAMQVTHKAINLMSTFRQAKSVCNFSCKARAPLSSRTPHANLAGVRACSPAAHPATYCMHARARATESQKRARHCRENFSGARTLVLVTRRTFARGAPAFTGVAYRGGKSKLCCPINAQLLGQEIGEFIGNNEASPSFARGLCIS